MVIPDTDILIASFRKNEMAKQLLVKYCSQLTISIVTEMELYAGANDERKKKAVKNVLADHDVVALNKAIGETALRLMKLYNTRTRSLYLADALIAATCLENDAWLLTFNTKDFKFIKGLKLAK